MILPASGINVSYKVQIIYPPVKTSYSPAENFNETPDALYNSFRQAGD